MALTNKPLLLAIDDEEGMREVIGGLAEQLGFEAVKASGKRRILESLDSNPDVVVLDLSMPDMDGIEVIWELVRRGSSARLILMSGFYQEVLQAAQSIASKTQLNWRGTLTKPADMTELRKMLTDVRDECCPADVV